MDMKSIVHELTMKYLEKDSSIFQKGPADYAAIYLQTFKSIEGYLTRHSFETIDDEDEPLQEIFDPKMR